MVTFHYILCFLIHCPFLIPGDCRLSKRQELPGNGCSCEVDPTKPVTATWVASIVFTDFNRSRLFVHGVILNEYSIIASGLPHLNQYYHRLSMEDFRVYTGPTSHNVTPPPSQSHIVESIQRSPVHTGSDFVILKLKDPILLNATASTCPVCLPTATTWSEFEHDYFPQNLTTQAVIGLTKLMDTIVAEFDIHRIRFCNGTITSWERTTTGFVCNLARDLDIGTIYWICNVVDGSAIGYRPATPAQPRTRFFLGFMLTIMAQTSHHQDCDQFMSLFLTVIPPTGLAWARLSMNCGPGDYTCDNGQCVSLKLACDRRHDCSDGSDEEPSYCRALNPCNPNTQFACGASGECIPSVDPVTAKVAAVCDGFKDCPKGEDEEHCVVEYSSNLPIVAGGLVGAAAIALLLGTVALVKWRRFKAAFRELTDEEIKGFREGVPAGETEEDPTQLNIRTLAYDKSYEYSPVDCIRGPQLRAGAFGVVYLAELHGQEAAVKVPKAARLSAQDFIALLSEVKAMQYIQNAGGHKNIVRFIGANTREIKNRKIEIALEFCALLSLDKFLSKNRPHFIADTAAAPPPPDQGNNAMRSHYTPMATMATINRFTHLDLIRWTTEVAEGMAFLASHRILHGDLAARNVLLDSTRTAKICDFGFVTQLAPHQNVYSSSNDRAFPWNLVAPEVFESSGRLRNIKSDVWSFGVLVWEIFTLGEVPWAERIPSAHFLQHLKAGRVLEAPPHASPQLYELMRSCWAVIPDERPAFHELVDSLGAI